jgi:hypothetical protein
MGRLDQRTGELEVADLRPNKMKCNRIFYIGIISTISAGRMITVGSGKLAAKGQKKAGP